METMEQFRTRKAEQEKEVEEGKRTKRLEFYITVNTNPYDYLAKHYEGYRRTRRESYQQEMIKIKDAEILGVY